MLNEIFIETGDGFEFSIYLTPGSKKEIFTSVIRNGSDIVIKISIRAKPTENQANDALIKFLSTKFKIAKSDIIIKKGFKSRNKKISVSGLKVSEIPHETRNIIESLKLNY